MSERNRHLSELSDGDVFDLAQLLDVRPASPEEYQYSGWYRGMAYNLPFLEHIEANSSDYGIETYGKLTQEIFLEQLPHLSDEQIEKLFDLYFHRGLTGTGLEPLGPQRLNQDDVLLFKKDLHDLGLMREATRVMVGGVIIPAPIPALWPGNGTVDRETGDLRNAYSYVQTCTLLDGSDPLTEMLLLPQWLSNNGVLYPAYLAANRLRNRIESHIRNGGSIRNAPESLLRDIKHFKAASPDKALRIPLLDSYFYLAPINRNPADAKLSKEGETDGVERLDRQWALSMMKLPDSEWRHRVSEIAQALNITPDSGAITPASIRAVVRFQELWPNAGMVFMQANSTFNERYNDVLRAFNENKTNLHTYALAAALTHAYPQRGRTMKMDVEDAIPNTGKLDRAPFATMTDEEWYLFRELRDQFDWGANGQVLSQMRNVAEMCEESGKIGCKSVNTAWMHYLVHEYATTQTADFFREFRRYLETGDSSILASRDIFSIPAWHRPESMTKNERTIMLQNKTFMGNLGMLIRLADEYYDTGDLSERLGSMLLETANSECEELGELLTLEELEPSNKLSVVTRAVTIARDRLKAGLDATSALRMVTVAERMGKTMLSDWKDTLQHKKTTTYEELEKNCEMVTQIIQFLVAVGDLPAEAATMEAVKPYTLQPAIRRLAQYSSAFQTKIIAPVIPDLLLFARAIGEKTVDRQGRYVHEKLLPAWLKKSGMYQMEEVFPRLVSMAEWVPELPAKQVSYWISRGIGSTFQTINGETVELLEREAGDSMVNAIIRVDGTVISNPFPILSELVPGIPLAAINYSRPA